MLAKFGVFWLPFLDFFIGGVRVYHFAFLQLLNVIAGQYITHHYLFKVALDRRCKDAHDKDKHRVAVVRGCRNLVKTTATILTNITQCDLHHTSEGLLTYN